jgi:hypothetical protein
MIQVQNDSKLMEIQYYTVDWAKKIKLNQLILCEHHWFFFLGAHKSKPVVHSVTLL